MLLFDRKQILTIITVDQIMLYVALVVLSVKMIYLATVSFIVGCLLNELSDQDLHYLSLIIIKIKQKSELDNLISCNFI